MPLPSTLSAQEFLSGWAPAALLIGEGPDDVPLLRYPAGSALGDVVSISTTPLP